MHGVVNFIFLIKKIEHYGHINKIMYFFDLLNRIMQNYLVI
jgi:hypothetical protein